MKTIDVYNLIKSCNNHKGALLKDSPIHLVVKGIYSELKWHKKKQTSDLCALTVLFGVRTRLNNDFHELSKQIKTSLTTISSDNVEDHLSIVADNLTNVLNDIEKQANIVAAQKYVAYLIKQG